MNTMFIGQGSSIVGVCVVYGLSSLVHHLVAYINPINNRNTIQYKREKQATRGKRQQKERRENKHTQENKERLNSESARKRRRIGIID
jgi:hypothetical protein